MLCKSRIAVFTEIESLKIMNVLLLQYNYSFINWNCKSNSYGESMLFMVCLLLQNFKQGFIVLYKKVTNSEKNKLPVYS